MSITNELNDIYNQLEDLTENTSLDDITPMERGITEHIRLILDQLVGAQRMTVEFDSFHRPGVPHVYMVWGHPEDTGLENNGELRAICSNRARAAKYKKVLEHENAHRANKYSKVYIEQRRLNHLYGAGMIWALRDIEIPDDVSDEVRKELEETLGRGEDNGGR